VFELQGSLVIVSRTAPTGASGDSLLGAHGSAVEGEISAIGEDCRVGATGLGFTVSSAPLAEAVRGA
jgi:hypothetical protein